MRPRIAFIIASERFRSRQVQKAVPARFLEYDVARNRRTSGSDKRGRGGLSRKPSAQSSRTLTPKNGNGRRHLAGLYRAGSATGRQRVGRNATRRPERFQ